MRRMVQPTSVRDVVLNRNSIYLPTAQLPHFMNQPMFAPVHMNSLLVRLPKTTSKSFEYASSLRMSQGSKEPSGSHKTIRSPVHSAMARWHEWPYPCLVSRTSRALVLATSSEVPGAALLFETITSSTKPVAKSPSMQV